MAKIQDSWAVRIFRHVSGTFSADEGNSRLLLVTIGIVLVVWHVAVLAAKGPFWLGLNMDPDYAYLLNSLDIARGLRPFHVDHPGTLVQLLGATIIRISHLFAKNSNLVEDVIRNSEHYLQIIAYTFFGLYALLLTVLALAVRAVTRNTIAAVIVQLTPLFASEIPGNLACAKPEAVLLSIAACVALATMIVIIRIDRRASPWMGLTFGVLAGAGLATKITAAPLFLISLFMLCGWRAWSAYFAATIIAGAVITIPAWPRLIYTFGFLERIATHAGLYGLGPPLHWELAIYWRTVINLLAGEPAMVAVMLTAILAVWIDRRRSEGRPEIRRAVLGFLAAQVVTVLMVARHPGGGFLGSGDHYLIPGLGLIGPTAAFAWILLAPAVTRQWSLVSGLLLGATALAVYQITTLCSVYRVLDIRHERQQAVVTYAHDRYPNAKIHYFYRASNPGFALYFGDNFAGMHYEKEIAAAYPAMSPWNGNPEPGHTTQLYQFQNSSSDVFYSVDWNRLGIKVTRVFGNNVEALYEVK